LPPKNEPSKPRAISRPRWLLACARDAFRHRRRDGVVNATARADLWLKHRFDLAH
jgi:hypothetical protein